MVPYSEYVKIHISFVAQSEISRWSKRKLKISSKQKTKVSPMVAVVLIKLGKKEQN